MSAEDLLRRIATDVDPIQSDSEWGETSCLFCGCGQISRYDVGKTTRTYGHYPSCVWIAAHHLLDVDIPPAHIPFKPDAPYTCEVCGWSVIQDDEGQRHYNDVPSQPHWDHLRHTYNSTRPVRDSLPEITTPRGSIEMIRAAGQTEGAAEYVIKVSWTPSGIIYMEGTTNE